MFTVSEESSCHNPNYKTIIQTFSQSTCPNRTHNRYVVVVVVVVIVIVVVVV